MRLRLVALTLLTLPLFAGCIIVPGLSALSRQDMNEVVVQESGRMFPRDRFLVLDISGVISEAKKEELLGEGTSMVEDVREALRMASEDHSIRALIIRVDSPGGTVTASDLIHHEIELFKEETDIPVVAMLMDVAASGGYYVASAADRIVASPTSVTGSIGVLMLTLNVQGLEDLAGVQVGALTSGPFKDIMSPFRAMTPEEHAILQSVIDDMYGRFVSVVTGARVQHGLASEEVRALADGRIYTATQAREAGLVDNIGYLPDLVNDLKREQGLDDVEVITYRRGAWGRYNLYSQMPQAPVINVSLMNMDAVTQGLEPGFYYLWMPGAVNLSRR